MEQDDSWKLDRRIPVAFILAIFLQFAGAIIWATELDARVSQIEKQNMGAAALYEKLARIEERMDYMKQDVASIKRQLDRFGDRSNK